MVPGLSVEFKGPNTFVSHKKAESGLPVILRTDKGDLASENFTSRDEALGAAYLAVNDPVFLEKVCQHFNLEVEQLTGIEVNAVQQGQLENIMLMELQLGGKTIELILATSKGYWTQERAEKILSEHPQEFRDSPLAPVFTAHIQKMSERQVQLDNHCLAYLAAIFRERNLPCEVPMPIAYAEKSVKSSVRAGLKLSSGGESQPVAVLAMERLSSEENCPAGEINPARKAPWLQPDFGWTVYWRANFFQNFERGTGWNMMAASGSETEKENSMRMMSEKTAELLSYVYFATGGLPHWFSPSAGDILFLGDKEIVRRAEDFHLGLITVRGGLRKLEKRYVPGIEEESSRDFPDAIYKPIEDPQIEKNPDIALLYDTLDKMRARLTTVDFGREVRATGVDAGTMRLFPREKWLNSGIVTAYEKFYGHSLTARDIPLGLLEKLGLSGSLSDVMGAEEASSLIAEVGVCRTAFMIREFSEELDKILTYATLSNNTAKAGHIETELINDGDFDSRQVASLDIAPAAIQSILQLLFGEPVENRKSRNDQVSLFIEKYKLPPRFVGGREGLEVELIRDLGSQRTWLECVKG